MTSHTKTAGEVRGKVILGDSTVKAEIEFINDAIENASDTEQVKTVISTGAGMAGVYNYGDWYLLEEVYLYGSGWKGQTGFTSVQRVPGITEMTMKEVQAAIKAIDPNIFVNHKRINAVLSHFRKFGYQIHPGNWFDATTANKIKWVINWNNTVFDHITVIDDTLVIGKPDQLAPVGAKTADPGNLLPSGQVAPVEGLIEPVHHQTRIEFYGMGNKGTGQTVMRPAAAGTKNDTAVKATADIGDGSEFNVGGGSAGSAGAAIAQVMGVVNGLIGALDTSFGHMTQTGLLRSEVGSDFALQGGIVNTGDGVTKDLKHYNTYDPAGNMLTGAEATPGDSMGGSGGDVLAVANPWVFVNLSGAWYAATWEWLRPGQTSKSRSAVNGDHIKQAPLASWSPSHGEDLYFMVSGLARSSQRNQQERTNLIKITWPASGGSASSSETIGIPTGVTWLHTNVSGWTQTGTLASVAVSGGTITLDYNKANVWTSVGV
jgi:hypothetical protein